MLGRCSLLDCPVATKKGGLEAGGLRLEAEGWAGGWEAPTLGTGRTREGESEAWPGHSEEKEVLAGCMGAKTAGGLGCRREGFC